MVLLQAVDATTQLLETGIMGAVVVLLGGYIIYLQRKLSEITEARIRDAQKVTRTVLELAKEQAETTQLLNVTLVENTGILETLREDIKDLEN